MPVDDRRQSVLTGKVGTCSWLGICWVKWIPPLVWGFFLLLSLCAAFSVGQLDDRWSITSQLVDLVVAAESTSHRPGRRNIHPRIIRAGPVPVSL